MQRQNAGSSPWWRQNKQRKIKVSSSKLEKLEHRVTKLAEATRPDYLIVVRHETYLSSLNHLSYTTHRRHQAILQALLNYDVEQGYLSSNPIARLRQRKPDRAKGEHSSDDLVR